MKNFKLMRHNFGEMPFLLRILTVSTILWVFSIVRTFLPFSEFNFYGISLTFGEYWATGLGFCHVGASSLLVWSGYLFLTKSPKARRIYVGTWSALMCFTFIFLLVHFGLENMLRIPYIWSDLVYWSVFTLLISWYLFSKQSVQTYFASENSAPQFGQETRRSPIIRDVEKFPRAVREREGSAGNSDKKPETPHSKRSD